MKIFSKAADTKMQSKKLSAIKISSAILLYLCVILIIGFAGCAPKDEGSNTATTQSATDLQIDEETYTFSEGIMIGSLSAGGKTYREVHTAAKKEVESLVKDFEISVTVGKSKHSFKRADFTYDNNLDDIMKQAVSYNNSKSSDDTKTFDLTFEVNEESVRKAVDALGEEIDCEPVDATISGIENKKATITKAVDGKKLQREKLTSDMVKLINTLSKGEKADSTIIKASVDTIKPSVTTSDLDSKITLLSSFTTTSTNTADGNHNMKLSLDSCNGSVILPGEVWSFNDCTGNSNLTSLGYRAATVIIGGKLEQGIGGGICQSSTTIYNAAIRTNMEIVERYCHYFQSTYADAGLDATIDWGNLDLKLKNPTDYPMYMQCYMSGTKLYCNIYGYQDPSFDTVEVDSYIYDANPKENYYKAAATRTFYKDGKVVYEEQLPYSTYHYNSPDEETTAPTTAAPTKPAPTKPAPKPTKPATTAPATTAPTQAPSTQKPTQAPATTVPATPVPTQTVTPTQPVEY
ncbi:MAG: VanW family protein [Ruminococcus sp.]|nr:VanW family protein [Ruminococcus sp.]